jgi:hypothetical protein
MRALGFGTIVLLAVLGISAGLRNWLQIIQVSGTVGIISFSLAGLLSGAFVSGDRVRAISTNETNEDKKSRKERTQTLFLFGLPNIVAATVYLIATQ